MGNEGTGGKITIRKYFSSDIDRILAIFRHSIFSACSADYTPEQLSAWAACADKILWQKSLAEHYSLVAQIDGILVGFADLDGAYFDRLYVHGDFLRRGIASKLANKIELCAQKSGKKNLTAHASCTAKPFFSKRGYLVVSEQHIERGGKLLTNFVMKKALAPV